MCANIKQYKKLEIRSDNVNILTAEGPNCCLNVVADNDFSAATTSHNVVFVAKQVSAAPEPLS